MNTLRISMVVPFYNNAEVLGDCLASIAAQTFRELEVIMVDDGCEILPAGRRQGRRAGL